MMLASAEACVILTLVKMVATVLHLVTVQCVHVHCSTLEQTVKVSARKQVHALYMFIISHVMRRELYRERKERNDPYATGLAHVQIWLLHHLHAVFIDGMQVRLYSLKLQSTVSFP